MSTKLEKLLAQVEEEKKRIAAQQRAAEKKQIDTIARLAVKAGLGSIPVVFLQPAFDKIALDFAANHAGSNE